MFYFSSLSLTVAFSIGWGAPILSQSIKLCLKKQKKDRQKLFVSITPVLGTWEVEDSGSWVQDQPLLHSGFEGSWFIGDSVSKQNKTGAWGWWDLKLSLETESKWTKVNSSLCWCHNNWERISLYCSVLEAEPVAWCVYPVFWTLRTHHPASALHTLWPFLPGSLAPPTDFSSLTLSVLERKKS